jgi:acylphosphatase
MNEPSHSGSRRFCRVLFEGRVQGVGFRFLTASAARTCRVNGYVRNLPDGSVELVAEGPTQNVQRLLDSLSQTFAGNIERKTVEEITQTAPPREFEIRH